MPSAMHTRTTTTRDTLDRTTAPGTTLGGATVTLQAGRDLGIVGSSVVGDHGTTLVAERDISIAAAQEPRQEGKAAGLSIGAGTSFDGKLVPGGSGAGIGKDGGSASSTTLAAISGIAGNTEARTGDAETGIGRIFDAEKVQREIDAQVKITQMFNEHAPKAAATYSANQVADLKRQAELETEPVRKAELLDEASKWGPNGAYNIAMNIIIGAAGSNLESAVTKEALSWAADEMRQAMIEDSKKFKGLCVSENDCINNISGQSVGVNGDGKKIAGGRIVLEAWCERGGVAACKKDSTTRSGYAENPDGTVIFMPADADGNSLTISEFIDQHQELRSELGGIQGGSGQMKLLGIQFEYAVNSFWDKLAEAYAGTHDTLNSIIWYDDLGNGKKLDKTLLGQVGNIANSTNVIVATPFALSVLLPTEVWATVFALWNMR